MKNHPATKLFLSFLLLTTTSVSAQHTDKHILKVNVPSLVFANFSFQYERAINQRQSVLLAIRYRPVGKIPFESIVQDMVDDNSIKVDLARIGNWGISPEYRFYLGRRGGMRGFYIGPFISYNHYKGDVPINYNDYDDVNNASIERTAVFKGSVNTFTAGFQLGAQWKLSNRLTLDWWIVGPNYGIGKGDFNFDGTLNDIEEISMDFELKKIEKSIPLIKIKDIVVRDNGTGASFKVDGPWAGIRAMGFNLGYRF